MFELDRKILERHLNKLLDLLWRNGSSGEENIDFIILLLLFKSLDISHQYIGITWDMVKYHPKDSNVEELLGEAKEQIDKFAGRELTGPRVLATSVQMLREAMEIVEEITKYINGQREGFGHIFDILAAATAKQKTMFVSTPLRLAKTLVRMVELQRSDTMIDPACGNGSFLIASSPYTNYIKGFDRNTFSVRITAANLILNQWAPMRGDVALADALDSSLDYMESKADAVLTNPPFSLKKIPAHLSRSIQYYDKQKQPSEILFLWRSLSLLKPGGRGAVILPDSFFYSELYVKARSRLFEMAHVDGIVSLQRGMFKPSSQLKVSVLLFRKKESHAAVTDYVWFYEMQPEDLSEAKYKFPEDDYIYQDLLAAWHARHHDAVKWSKARDKAYPFLSYPLPHVERKNIAFASYKEIADQNFNLNMARYRYIEPLTETYGNPDELLREVLDLEEQLAQDLRELLEQSRWITEPVTQEIPDVTRTARPHADDSTREEKDMAFDKIIKEVEESKRRKLLNVNREELHSSLGWFINELAGWQKRLLERFYKSPQPLAAHEAAKKIIGVQEALQTISLFESFGILERAEHLKIDIPSFNGVDTETTVVDRQGKPLSMHRWQPAISFLDGENT